MEESTENGKELSHSAHANGMNEWINQNILITIILNYLYLVSFLDNKCPVLHNHKYKNKITCISYVT
jgi:hypothetical protein